MSLCTNGIGLQVLPFRDNMHLGSIHRFQWFSCYSFLLSGFWLAHENDQTFPSFRISSMVGTP